VININGYNVLEKIHTGKFEIYRGIRFQDGQPVIIKVLANPYPTEDMISKFNLEYDIIHRLSDLDSVINVYDIVDYKKTRAIFMEDVGGISLNAYLKNRELSVKELLAITIKIVKAIDDIHQCGVVHKDINPTNILIDPLTKNIKMIDFGIASLLKHERASTQMLNRIEGTIQYMSPEQTGRMNRDLDYRSDYYSLGITFYEMFCGELPFESEDILEFMHMHIAKEVPWNRSFSNLPLPITKIISKLISKEQDERYQSTFGLLHDLNICLQHVDSDLNGIEFYVGEEDRHYHFKIPQKIYGREEEIQVLVEGVESSINGGNELFFITGNPGSGKSVLVSEVHQKILKHQCYFTQAKADQFKQDMPYLVLINALKDLINQFLMESDQKIEMWRDLLLESLGPNGQIISDMIPEFETLIGKLPPVQELDQNEAMNRFIDTLGKFFSTVACREHPMVLFIDDLQWCDVGSLKLIEAFVGNNKLPFTCLIIAYRDNEIISSHPLFSIMKKAMESRTIRNVHLEPLNSDSIDAMIAESLNSSLEVTRPLSRLVYEKTKGNPFFVGELLKTLHKKEYIYYDPELNALSWDFESIKAYEISENVVEFVLNKLRALPNDCQSILQIAACLGSRFDMKELMCVCGQTKQVLAENIWLAVREEVIMPLNDNYRFLLNLKSYGHINFENHELKFRFVHDRIQQAAYNLNDSHHQKQVHLAIARLLINLEPNRDQEDRLIECVDHYNKAINLVKDPAEKRIIAELNLKVAKKTKKSIAYQNAYEHIVKAYSLMSEESWIKDYALMHEISVEYAMISYLVSRVDEAETQIEKLLSCVKTIEEKAEIYNLKANQYLTLSKMEEAVDVALEGLALLGVQVPRDPSDVVVLKELMLVRYYLKGKAVESLVDHPVLVDERIKLIINLLVTIVPTVYILGKNKLFGWISFKLVNLSLKYGHFDQSAFIYSLYGMVLCASLEKYEESIEYGNLSMVLNEKYHDVKTECRIYHSYASFIMTWKAHFSDSTELLKKGMYLANLVGDYQYVAYMALHLHAWDQTLTLSELCHEKEKHREIVEKANYQDFVDGLDIFNSMCLNFRDMTDGKYSLNNGSFNEDECLRTMGEREFIAGITIFYLRKAEIHYFYNDFKTALDFIQESSKTQETVMGLPYVVRFAFMNFLIHAENEINESVLKKEYKKMKKWGDVNPLNFKHLELIMGAVLSQLKDSKVEMQTVRKFDEAIAFANKNNWIRDEALANELAAKYLISNGMKKSAVGYIKDAHYLYTRWGAIRKTKDLEMQYKQLFEVQLQSEQLSHVILNKSSHSSTGFNEKLDLMTIIKSAQTISSEINLESLMIKIMKIVLENAGAEKGWFITEAQGELMVQAEASYTVDEVKIYEDLKLDQCRDLSSKAINLVARTHKDIVYMDASQSPETLGDSYIQSNQTKSLLVLALVRNDKLKGVLYLENNKVKGAFSEERVDLLKMLSTEMVISLENAELYRGLENYSVKLERKVDERTKELMKANQSLFDKNQKLMDVQSELELMAMTDPLTGLFNRRSMIAKIESEFKKAADFNMPFSIMIMDVDNFKQFNDNYGHDCGDYVLKQLALIIQNTSRDCDAVARWGGEEFLVLLPNTKRDDSLEVAERIRGTVEYHAFNYESEQLSITLTIGLGRYTSESESIDSIIKKADIALYDGKVSGKNCVTVG